MEVQKRGTVSTKETILSIPRLCRRAGRELTACDDPRTSGIQDPGALFETNPNLPLIWNPHFVSEWRAVRIAYFLVSCTTACPNTIAKIQRRDIKMSPMPSQLTADTKRCPNALELLFVRDLAIYSSTHIRSAACVRAFQAANSPNQFRAAEEHQFPVPSRHKELAAERCSLQDQ